MYNKEKKEINCSHNHTKEEITFYGCETGLQPCGLPLPPEQIKKSVDDIKERIRWARSVARNDKEFLLLCDCAVDESYILGQQEVKESLREKIEGLRNDVRPEITVWLKGNRETNEAQNEMLDQVLTLLADVSPKTTDNKEKV